ncbi:MAG: tetratricopeptide repeat protein [Nitrospirota bacterium]
MAKGNFERAMIENEKILLEFPNRPPGDEALFNMGLLCAHYGNPQKDYNKAAGFFWKLIRDFPKSPKVNEAKIWIGVLNVIEETQRKLEQQEAAAIPFLSDGHIEYRDIEEAFRQNQEILAKFPDEPPADSALFNMGLLSLHFDNRQKDYRKAHGFFERLIKDFPESPKAEEAKIWAGVLKTVEESRAEIEKRQTAHGHLSRSQKFLGEGNFERALEESEKALSRAGNSPPGDEALFNMGIVFAHDKNYEKALNSFKRILKDFPRSSRIGEAKVWVEVLAVIEETKKIDIEIEEKKKELSR